MNGLPRHIIVGTAGHIDHGKTALVEALTGINADRWEEERRRGITIDIGFAHLDCGPDLQLEFIDVPGHERFVRNMLAGAGGVDLALVVVAGDESIMPQTREHFDICRLLGIHSGVIAITKADLVEPDLRELVELEVREFVAGSFLEDVPVIAVSAKTGEGLPALRTALEDAARRAVRKSAERRFRLPIDRAFTIKGFGTVVTGTLVSGEVAAGEDVQIYPIGKVCRVRGVQVHGKPAKKATAGQRTALNLAGVDTEELRRGLVAGEPKMLRPTARFDCRLELLESAPPLKHGAPVHLHAGAAEIEAKALLLGGNEAGKRLVRLGPGESAFAQIRLEEPTLLLPGDRFVIRRFSPVVTIGGGTVLDIAAPARQRWEQRRARLTAFESEDAGEVLRALVSERRYGLDVRNLIERTGWTDKQISAALKSCEELERLGGTLIAGRARVREVADAAEAELTEFHRAQPLEPGASAEWLRKRVCSAAPAAFTEAVEAALIGSGKALREADLLRLAAHNVTLGRDEQEARDRFVEAFHAAGLAVPALKEFLRTVGVDGARAKTLLAALLREGVLIRVTPELVFHRDAMDELLQRLSERKAVSNSISVGEFKDLAGVSRKYAIPLLEYLDRRRVTRRHGETRLLL